jgi:hypothetical protein
VNPSVDVTAARVDVVRAAQERWRADLADLGGRNTLLWHRELPLGTFDLTVAHPGGVAKLLAGGPTRLSELVREKVAFGAALRTVGAIRGKTLQMRREHGLTTGFIAVGLASWTLPRSKTQPRAPVLLRRCRIHPVDASHRDYVVELDADVVFNPVLDNYLRGEVGIDIDPVELARLSTMEGGFDPRAVYDELEYLCQDMPGFSIGPNMVISTYPWAKLPLVAHLSMDPARLATHDLVAALAGDEVRPPVVTPDPVRADDPAQELSVLDADHDQRVVVDEVARGASLVIDTPAGTGATQTVTNMVAAALAQGHTTLVVSEERPALDAMRRRLAHVGLHDIVLDLPEDPRRARAAVARLAEQLEAAVDTPEPDFPDDPLQAWRQAQQTLRIHEVRMHTPHAPWGRTLSQTQSALARLAGLDRPPLSHVRLELPVLQTLTPERLAEVTAVLVEAARIGVWQRGRVEDPWYGAELTDEDDDAPRAAEIVAGLVAGDLAAARGQMRQVCREAGLPEPLNLTQWAQRLDLVGRAHETLDVFQQQIYDAPLEDMVAATSAKGPTRPGAVSRGRLRRQVRTLLRPGPPPPDLADRVRAARDERAEWEELAGRAARPSTPDGWEEALDAFVPIEKDLTWLAGVLQHTPSGQDLMTTHLDLLLDRLLRLDARAERVAVAARAHGLLQPLRDAGLGPLVDDLARRGISADDVATEVEFVHQASLHDHLTRDEVGVPSSEDLLEASRILRRADREHLARNAARVRRTLHRRLQRVIAAHPTQVTTLRQAAAAGVHDIREVLHFCPDVVMALRPCLVGSPLVVPATLPEHLRVRLVVVEHAGRTRTAHVVAALTHGTQTVVVGDRLRPPPTAFSCVVEETPADPRPLSSLLDDARLVLPARTFTTHYRALDQRLVDPLGLVAEPHIEGFPGVLRTPRFTERVVEDAPALVRAAVGAVLERVRRRPDRSVVLLVDDSALCAAVDEALGLALAEDRASCLALSEDAPEPFHLTVTDRWAGEVRDHVVWVGALTADGMPAHRVSTALAAARRTVTLVTTDPVRSWPAGVGTSVATALLAPGPSDDDTPAVPTLLADLARRLEAEGLTVRHDVGHGRHAVPLGIEDPSRPGRLIVAVDSDLEPLTDTPGRDHFRLRPEQLTRLGWGHTRVRSSELFRDPAREVARLVTLVREVSTRTRPDDR